MKKWTINNSTYVMAHPKKQKKKTSHDDYDNNINRYIIFFVHTLRKLGFAVHSRVNFFVVTSLMYKNDCKWDWLSKSSKAAVAWDLHTLALSRLLRGLLFYHHPVYQSVERATIWLLSLKQRRLWLNFHSFQDELVTITNQPFTFPSLLSIHNTHKIQ
jgi:hypothetical protein